VWKRLRGSLRSLRWRLTLTFVVLLALLLAALGTYQYVTLRSNLVGVRAAALRGDLDEALALTARLGRLRGNAAEATAARDALCLGTGSGAGLTKGAAAMTLASRIAIASGPQVDSVIYDRNLQAIGHTPGSDPAALPRLSSGPLNQALGGATPGAEIIDGGSEGRQLVAAFPLTARSGALVCGVVQLSTSTEQIDDVLDSELRRLILASAGVLLLALLAGLLLTGRALRPLRRLTETARALAGGNLRARSQVPARDDEVGTLARSFDDMAERIEDSFATQAQSEARMRRFIADASHELRTPVTALKGYIDVLRRGAARDREALDSSLEAMGREAERMRVLVLDLLTLARLDAQQRAPGSAPLPLASLLTRVLDDGVPGMPDQVQRHLDPDVVVLGDDDAVATIAINLLVNSCKYAPGAAQTWWLWRDGDRGGFAVRDDGPGISPVDLPHVFERFYRGEKTRAREEGGSGLGLSIAQSLARAMDGEVAVDSREGLGTTVTVTLPLAATPAQAGRDTSMRT